MVSLHIDFIALLCDTVRADPWRKCCYKKFIIRSYHQTNMKSQKSSQVEFSGGPASTCPKRWSKSILPSSCHVLTWIIKWWAKWSQCPLHWPPWVRGSSLLYARQWTHIIISPPILSDSAGQPCSSPISSDLYEVPRLNGRTWSRTWVFWIRHKYSFLYTHGL